MSPRHAASLLKQVLSWPLAIVSPFFASLAIRGAGKELDYLRHPLLNLKALRMLQDTEGAVQPAGDEV